MSTVFHEKSIHVSGRTTILNLMIGLDGYTISIGIVNADLDGDNIASVPLIVDNKIQVGWISDRQIQLSKQVLSYMGELRGVVDGYGFTLEE